MTGKLMSPGRLGNTKPPSTFSLCSRHSEHRGLAKPDEVGLTQPSMLVCAVLCAIQAINNFGSPIFAQMVVSLISTYGVFVVSSLLALDPW